MPKRCLITGVSGQTGSYLAEILNDNGYEVHGIIRRSSSINTRRIDPIFKPESREFIHFGDLAGGIDTLLYELQPDIVFNLAAMSHVKVSFDIPTYTADINALGVVRILEAIKGLKLKHTRFIQSSSSEMYGITPPPQNEDSPFRPVSPYGVAKLYGYGITKSYRTGYNMFASNSIKFNHESPRRGETFVTRKITIAATRIKVGLQAALSLGNLDAIRDWGFAGDYAMADFLISQHNEPDDFVVSTGEAHTVREFLVAVFDYLDLDVNKYVVIDKDLRRPNEVPALLGDSTKIRKVLGWEPKIKYKDLVKLMVDSDLKLAQQELNNAAYHSTPG